MADALPPLSAATLAALQARHTPQTAATGGAQWCHQCGGVYPWPCDAARLLAEVARLQAENDAMRADLDAANWS